MMRVLLAGSFFVAMAIAALLAMAVVAGRFAAADQLVGMLVALLAVAAIAGWRLPRERMVQIATHGALLSGCLVFVFPFAWLVSTSMKYDEEIFVYPPRWLPAWPQAVEKSPYLSGELLAGAEQLQRVSAERWQTLWPQLEPAIWVRGQKLLDGAGGARLEQGALRRALTRVLAAAATP